MEKSNGADLRESRQSGLTHFEGRLLRVLGLMLVQERQQGEQIDLLARAGFRPVEIAAMLGTTSNTVNVALSNRRARNRVGRKLKE